MVPRKTSSSEVRFLNADANSSTNPRTDYVIQGLREVGFFLETIEAGSQAFEDSPMIEKLELKEW